MRKVYEFPPPEVPRDDDVIDCCSRHYQMSLAAPSLETFRPGSGGGESAATAVSGLAGDCCSLVSTAHRYGATTTTAAAAAVLRIQDHRRSVAT